MIVACISAAAMSGCGGSSVGGNRSTTTTAINVTTGTTSAVQLGPKGVIEVSYLTGAGRGVDSNIAVEVSQETFQDQYSYITSNLPSPLVLSEATYGGPSVIDTYVPFGVSSTTNVPSSNPNSRTFTQYTLAVSQLDYTTNGATFNIPPTSIFAGVSGSLLGTNGDSTASTLGLGFTPVAYPATITAFPGRVTSLTVRLDPNVFGVNTAFDPTNTYGPTNPRGVWEPTQFSTINLTPDNNNTFQAVLSDFMSFDLTGMAANLRPTLTSGAAAGKLYFSGDNYAISDSVDGGEFDELTKSPGGTPFTGHFNSNSATSGYGAPPGVSLSLPGTYSLTQPDPSDTSYLRKIISLEGMWRDYTKLLTVTGNTFAVTFPSSSDNSVQDMVVGHIGASGKLIDVRFGYIDMEAHQVYLYPLANLVSASATNETDGTITNTFTSTGAVANANTGGAPSVRTGTFTLATPITFAGDGAQYSGGTFVVFRK